MADGFLVARSGMQVVRRVRSLKNRRIFILSCGMVKTQDISNDRSHDREVTNNFIRQASVKEIANTARFLSYAIIVEQLAIVSTR